MQKNKKKQAISILSACFIFALSACSEHTQQNQQMPSPEVGVYVVKPQNIQLTTELPSRTSAYATAEVRPQVNGILQKRLFTEGSLVKQGQVLYQIDPAPYQAAYDKAKAALEVAKLTYDRYNELVKSNAISKQQFDDAYAQYLQAKAAFDSAKIDLGYTRIIAPITGKIGRSTVTQGALLAAYQATALATIQQLDPIYVDIPQSSTALLRLQEDIASGLLVQDGDKHVQVSIQLDNGQEYDHVGRLQFSEVTVDEGTNTVTLRAIFPNPEGKLLPGMFVRTRLNEGSRESAIIVPQKGITRNNEGEATALIVNKDNVAELRQVDTDRTYGSNWIIRSGLSAGDKVIVSGIQKVQVGGKTNPTDVDAPKAQQPAAQKQEANAQAAAK